MTHRTLFSSSPTWTLLLATTLCFACGTGSTTSAAPATQNPNQAATTPTPQDGNQAPGTTPAGGGNDVPPAQTAPGGLAGPSVNGNAVVAIGALGGPNNAYTLIGRFDATTPTALRMSLPNSRIGATFTGTSLGVMLGGDGNDGYGVQIDGGNVVLVVHAGPSPQPIAYPVAQNLAPGKHTVWLTKRTESYEVDQTNSNVRTGTGTFYGFFLDAGAALGPAPAPRPHLLVAVGDSSFTGYGVDQLQNPNLSCVYSPGTQNALLSVPGQLADLLGAEVINVSASGKGIAQSAYDLTNTDQLPELWKKTVPPAATPAYAFPALDVDAVLISAGSDDLVGAYGSGTITNTSLFVSKYAALLADARLHYPKAVLVGIINPNAIDSDKATLHTYVGQAIAQRNAAGDAKAFVYDYFAGDPDQWVSYNDADYALGLGHGCQGHASPAGSAFLAQRLATFLRTKASF